jgi:hypothetical protein
MAGHRHTIRSTRRLIAAVACASSFTLAACGGGGGANDAIDDFRDQIDGSATNGGDDTGAGQSGGDSFGDASPRDVQPPTFLLTGGVDAPAGWVEDPVGCAGDDGPGPPFFNYHVPPEWNRTGSGSGGSGSGIDGSGNHTYALPDGSGVEVGVSTDSYIGTEPTDSATGEPWESWDHDITSYGSDGEDSTRATYDRLDPVEIDGESVDLWFLDQHQHDLVRSSEYKARIVFADVPTGGVAGQDRQPYSATVTFDWNADSGALDEGLVRDVLGTFRVDECVQEAMISLFETLNGVTWSD